MESEFCCDKERVRVKISENRKVQLHFQTKVQFIYDFGIIDHAELVLGKERIEGDTIPTKRFRFQNGDQISQRRCQIYNGIGKANESIS